MESPVDVIPSGEPSLSNSQVAESDLTQSMLPYGKTIKRKDTICKILCRDLRRFIVEMFEKSDEKSVINFLVNNPDIPDHMKSDVSFRFVV